jgi:hypothetical protein
MAFNLLPGLYPRDTYPELPLGKVNSFARPLEIAVGQNLAPLEHENCLNQACDAAGSFKMADLEIAQIA